MVWERNISLTQRMCEAGLWSHELVSGSALDQQQNSSQSQVNLRETAFASSPQQKIFFLSSSQDHSKFAFDQIQFIYLFLIPLIYIDMALLKLKRRILLKWKCCGFIYFYYSINIRSYTLHYFFPDYFAWGTKSGSLALLQLFSCQCEYLLSLKSSL